MGVWHEEDTYAHNQAAILVYMLALGSYISLFDICGTYSIMFLPADVIGTHTVSPIKEKFINNVSCIPTKKTTTVKTTAFVS